jgi:tetratricopeptide (TPR) repeat protein
VTRVPTSRSKLEPMDACEIAAGARRRTPWWITAVALLLGLLASLAPRPAAAEPKEEARKLLDAGDRFLKKGEALDRRGKRDLAAAEYERALEAYEKAYDRVANAQIYYAIAGAEAKLGRTLDAIGHYRKLLAEGGDALKPAVREAALAAIEAQAQLVAVIILHVSPAGATIAIDGSDIGNAPLADPLYLLPGEHTIAVTADGYTPYEIKSSFEAGSESERTIGLEPVPVIVEAPTRPKPRPSRPVPEPEVSRTQLYVGLGATGAFLAGATITGVMAVSRHGTYSDTDVAVDERSAARDSGKTLALVTDLLLVGTAAAGAYTAYHYYRVYKPRSEAREERNRERMEAWEEESGAGAALDAAPPVLVTPYVGDGGGGLVVSGRF